MEIENILLLHPDRLLADVAVAGVRGSRFEDEYVPRAWIVLSEAGRRRGERKVVAALEQWLSTQLSKQKRVRGGFQVVDQVSLVSLYPFVLVSLFFFLSRSSVCSWLTAAAVFSDCVFLFIFKSEFAGGTCLTHVYARTAPEPVPGFAARHTESRRD